MIPFPSDEVYNMVKRTIKVKVAGIPATTESWNIVLSGPCAMVQRCYQTNERDHVAVSASVNANLICVVHVTVYYPVSWK